MLLKNFLSLFFASLASFILSVVLNHYTKIVTKDYHYSILFMLVLFLILNLVYLFNSASSNLTQILLAGTVTKLLFSFVAVIVYSILRGNDFFGFSLHFVSHYVLFVVFEIRYLLQVIKRNESSKIKP